MKVGILYLWINKIAVDMLMNELEHESSSFFHI